MRDEDARSLEVHFEVFERGAASEGGQGCTEEARMPGVPLGRLPILTVRADCTLAEPPPTPATRAAFQE
eukprot:1808899-Pyramimonas_sp.AAC.1